MYFDSISTHSFVSPLFANNLIEKPIPLDCPLLVTTPLGETLLVRDGYHSCKVMVGKVDTVADLMLLEMSDFDLILGMDYWLASCLVTLDCLGKAINFEIPGETLFTFQGERSMIPNNLISLMSVRSLLQKGCQGFLAFVRDVEKKQQGPRGRTSSSEVC